MTWQRGDGPTTRHRRWWPSAIPATVVAALVVTGCGTTERVDRATTAAPEPSATAATSPPAPETATGTPAQPSGRSTPRPTTTPGADMSTRDQAVAAAVADLEGRPGTGSAPVEVLRVRHETFRTDPPGCPGLVVDGQGVAGTRITLRRGDRVWLYVAPDGAEPRLCPSRDKDGGRGFVPPPGMDD